MKSEEIKTKWVGWSADDKLLLAFTKEQVEDITATIAELEEIKKRAEGMASILRTQGSYKELYDIDYIIKGVNL